MHSFLIVSKNPIEQETQIKNLLKEYSVYPLDQTIIDPEKSIGIEEIRLLQKTLSLKPLKGSTKTVIIKSAERLTLQAQNALLKTLEEPPLHTIIILTSPKKELLLPTIISRCFVIESQKTQDVEKKEIEKQKEFIQKLSSLSLDERMKYAEVFAKSKEEAIAFLEESLTVGHKMLVQNPEDQLKKLLSRLQKTHTIISTTNANLRFALEDLFLNV